MRSLRFSFVVVLVLFAAGLPTGAQIVRGGDVVVADINPNRIWRVTPSGQASEILNGAPLMLPSDVAVTKNREIIVTNFNGANLVRIDPAGNRVTLGRNLNGPIRVAVDIDGDYIVTSLIGKALLSVSPGGAVTTVYAGSPLFRPYGVAVDANGDYLVTDEQTDSLFRITPGGVLSTIHQRFPFSLPQGVAVLHNGDYAVIDGSVDKVFRVPRLGGPITTIVGPRLLGNPNGVHVDFQGGVFVSGSGGSSGNRVLRVDSSGNVTPIAVAQGFGTLQSLGAVPFVSAPDVATTGPGSVFQLNLDFPNDPGVRYTLAAAASVYPGFALAAPDPRGISLNPDPLFIATLLRNAAPVFANWTSTLDASGRASASFDLRALSPGLLAGVNLYVQGATMKPSAPNGIGTVGNLIVLPFK